jgi:hypothetical protein
VAGGIIVLGVVSQKEESGSPGLQERSVRAISLGSLSNQHLGGKQREYEFFGLTPDTEYLGTIMILVPTWSKESSPYVCGVKTLSGEL